VDYPTKHLASVALLLLAATSTSGTWCKKNIHNAYSENLAVHRKSWKTTKATSKKLHRKIYRKKPGHITPKHAINDQLDYLLTRKKAVNEQTQYVQGYTIQVYAGRSREKAFKIKHKLYTCYPAITPEVIYHLPNYIVSLGKFLDKLEAYPAYDAIRRWMPQAIIRPISLINRPDTFLNTKAANTAPVATNSKHVPGAAVD